MALKFLESLHWWFNYLLQGPPDALHLHFQLLQG